MDPRRPAAADPAGDVTWLQRTKTLGADAACVRCPRQFPATPAPQFCSARRLDGSKIVEARTYDISAQGGFGDEWFWLVETPGAERQEGDTAHITGCVKFSSEAVRYTSLEQWRADEDNHRIVAGSDYDWNRRGAMYGWRVERAYALRRPLPGPKKKGIINSKPIMRRVPRDGWVAEE